MGNPSWGPGRHAGRGCISEVQDAAVSALNVLRAQVFLSSPTDPRRGVTQVWLQPLSSSPVPGAHDEEDGFDYRHRDHDPYSPSLAERSENYAADSTREFPLHVESELHDVAILHHVALALHAGLAFRAGLGD